MANNDLLKKTLAWIEKHPEDWNQDAWRCESGMCFAGVACELAGGIWVTEPESLFAEYLFADEEDVASTTLRFKDIGDGAPLVTASKRAERLLGLNAEQADWLFSAHGGLQETRRAVSEITGES